MEQKKLLRRILFVCIGFLFSVCAFAQQITVTGHVKDNTSEPIIGVNISIQGTKVGTVTDINGNYVL